MYSILQSKPVWMLGVATLTALESYAFHLKPRSLIYMTPKQFTGEENTLSLRTKLWIKLPTFISLASVSYLILTSMPKLTLLESVALVIGLIAIRTFISGSFKIPFTKLKYEPIRPYSPDNFVFPPQQNSESPPRFNSPPRGVNPAIVEILRNEGPPPSPGLSPFPDKKID